MNGFIPSSWIWIIPNSFCHSYPRTFSTMYVRSKENKCNTKKTNHRCHFGSSIFFANTLQIQKLRTYIQMASSMLVAFFENDVWVMFNSHPTIVTDLKAPTSRCHQNYLWIEDPWLLLKHKLWYHACSQFYN